MVLPSLTSIQRLDDELSKRDISLDPDGYFLIYLDRAAGLICAEHYSNLIDEQGLAVDPDTGEVLACRGALRRLPTGIYRGRSAKELGKLLVEDTDPCPLSKLDHALYLGREFQKAEACLLNGTDYVQD
jgi:hypothetical protein